MSNFMRTSEYQSLLTLNKSQLVQAASGQSSIINYGIKLQDNTSLAANLGLVATILAMLFLKSKAVGLSTGITSLFVSILPDEKAATERLAISGLNGLNEIAAFMDRNTNYDLVEIRAPFLEYQYLDSTENWRIVSGKPVINRLRVAGTGQWIVAT